MPEEINRLVTDAIADVLWTPSPDANENLIREGVDSGKIDLIGNIMIDSFELLRDKILAVNEPASIGIDPGSYALVTLHRPSNVDSVDTLKPIVEELIRISKSVPVLFVAHPRTIKGLEKSGLKNSLESCADIHLLEPIPYIRFMSLVTAAKLVITDSGGLQEETTYLGIPCLTMRDNTERPITVSIGTNRLVNVATLADHLQKVLDGDWPTGECPPLWDGKTAERAVAALKERAGTN